MKTALVWTCLLVGIGSAIAQPSVSAVQNAASNALAGLPNSGIAQGSLFLVYGSNLGPATLVQASTYPLPTTAGLAGTSVQVTVNGATANCIMVYSYATQVAAILPSSAPVGTGTLTVKYNGQTSATAPISVVASQFGTFSVNQQGTGAGIVTFADYSLVTVSNAAKPGDTLLIWGTGLGAVQGDEAAAPRPGDLTNIPVQVYVGSTTAALTYRGRSGCCAGLDQIAFVVPSGQEGCSVPVVVKINNSVSNFTTMAVSSTSKVCSDPGGFTGTQLTDLFNKPVVNAGILGLSHTNTQTAPIGGFGGGTTIEDDAIGVFYRLTIPQGQFPTSLLQPVSIGACTLTTYSGQVANPFQNITISGLDAGAALTVNGPAGTRTLTKSTAGGLTTYSAKLGDGTPGNYLDPGSYTINGPGGADVGAFAAKLTVAPTLTWTNESSVSTVTRGSGQLVTWTGGDPAGYINIDGSSFALLTGNNFVGASFTCRARSSDGQFTIPAVVLLALPPSTSVQGFAFPGSLSIGTEGTPLQFTASGLDFAYASYSSTSSKSVTYQ